jgi:UTP-glucose-1-phosphate uridylyltransferase
MKISIQIIPDGHPDGYGEAHLQANGAVTHDPFVELLPILLHRTPGAVALVSSSLQ